MAQAGVALVMAAAAYRPIRAGAVRRPSFRGARVGLPALVAGAAAVAFIAVTLWWLLEDGWIPNGDAGRHLVIVNHYLLGVENGELWRPLDSPPVIDDEFYPPFVHIVGMLGSLVAGFGVFTPVLTLNLVFVPLLALGCYGIGSYVYGRWAGALAVVFVLGAPMLVAQFHVFMLDAPLTALVAVSVWLLLLADGFSRPGIAALAGVAVGCGAMTKVTFLLFIAGLVAVLLLRGGWRNATGIALFVGAALLVSQPWLMLNEDILRDRTSDEFDVDLVIGVALLLVAAGVVSMALARGAWRSRTGIAMLAGAALLVGQFWLLRDGALPWEGGNYGAHFWGALTVQLLAPLFLFFVVGLGSAIWSAVRLRARGGELELVVGLVVGVIGVASMDSYDPRYSMPLLPYAAVLGVGWITALPQVRLRLAGAAAVAAVALTNSVMVNSGLGEPVRFGLPLTDRHATLVSDGGYVENQPRRESWMPELLEAARDAGAEQVMFQPESLNTGGYNLNGLTVLGRAADLSVRPPYLVQELNEHDIYLARLAVDSTKERPCIVIGGAYRGEYGIYVFRGGPIAEGRPSWCPPGWEQRVVDY